MNDMIDILFIFSFLSFFGTFFFLLLRNGVGAGVSGIMCIIMVSLTIVCTAMDDDACDKKLQTKAWQEYDESIRIAPLIIDAGVDSSYYQLAILMADRRRVIDLHECRCSINDRP